MPGHAVNSARGAAPAEGDGVQRLTTANLITYAAPVGATNFLWMPTMSILPGIYAKHFGLGLTEIAAVLLIARIADGFSDPLIGFLADRHRAKGGAYRSWVLAGGIGLVVSAFFLFTPPTPATQSYYLICSLGFYLSWSMMDIPHAAWGATLASSYERRAVVFSSRTFALFIGLIAFFALPFLPIFETSEYTPETMRATGYAGAGIMLACLGLVLFTPRGTIMAPLRPDSPRAVLRSIVRSRPLALFLSANFIAGIGFGMWFGLIFLYLDAYLRLGSWISTIFLWANIVAGLSVPFWFRLVRATSKSAVWAIASGLYLLLLLSCLVLQPGGSMWIPLIVTAGIYICFGGHAMASSSVLADVADYGQWKFGRACGGLYFALSGLSYKITSGLGAGLSLWIAGAAGFDATSTTQTEAGVFGFKLAFIFIPTILVAISLPLILASPITKRRHAIIRRRIDAHPA